jgi:hypothetical protein
VNFGAISNWREKTNKFASDFKDEGKIIMTNKINEAIT